MGQRQCDRLLRPAVRVEAVTLQFHPDWPHGEQKIIESLAADRVYRSQFATGVSNGGLTAFPGGDRWRWESRLFHRHYDDRPTSERPVYGAWNRGADPRGGAIRFGSSYLRLEPGVMHRTTFCFPDSAQGPTGIGDATLLPSLCHRADESGLDDLDSAVEAHVHGAVKLDRDVEAIVLDPCFADTAVAEAAARTGCRVEFHAGFRATPDDIDETYRGAHIVELARALGPVLTPNVVGDAARRGEHPRQWIKQVWHCLARFGRARE